MGTPDGEKQIEMDGAQGRREMMEFTGSRSLKTRLYQESGVEVRVGRASWTSRSDVVSVGIGGAGGGRGGGGESAGVWVFLSDEQQHSQSNTTSVL